MRSVLIGGLALVTAGGVIWLLAQPSITRKRCEEIPYRQLSAEIHERAEKAFEVELSTQSNGSGHSYYSLPESTRTFLRRSLRAQKAAEFRAREIREYRSKSPMTGVDSSMLEYYERQAPSLDSLEPEPNPPPRPSELAWYAEHCYEGKPRSE